MVNAKARWLLSNARIPSFRQRANLDPRTRLKAPARIFLICLCFVLNPLAHADLVVPDQRVENGVTIRELPTTESANLGLLRPGESLPFEGAVPRWNRVQLADGRLAFLSKSWTDVIPETVSGEVVLHAVDVGTGLAVILQGQDFTLLYDGGSNDDIELGSSNRLSAYLVAALPNLMRIDHLILSHPHRDHVELLPDLFDQYEIANVWDSGALNDICGYRSFLTKVRDADTAYHDALGNFGQHSVEFSAKSCYGTQLSQETITIDRGSRIDDQPLALGQTATATFLHIDGTQHSSPNENSLVVRIDVNGRSILLMGDAEAGGRQDPSMPPSAGSIEGSLLQCCSTELEADVLVVGHHGSMTSSRSAFLDAVDADDFIVSSGPTRYGSVVLPDQVVIDELTSRGTVWRTDTDDDACGADSAKIGPDADGEAGGCDNIQLTISNAGMITAQFATISD